MQNTAKVSYSWGRISLVIRKIQICNNDHINDVNTVAVTTVVIGDETSIRNKIDPVVVNKLIEDTRMTRLNAKVILLFYRSVYSLRQVGNSIKNCKPNTESRDLEMSVLHEGVFSF